MHVLSTAEIRQKFPALQRSHLGRPVAFFDGPGGTQVPTPVVDAMADYLYHHNANTHWAYPTSEETDNIIESARTVFAEFFSAISADTIVSWNWHFGDGTTDHKGHRNQANDKVERSACHGRSQQST